MNSLKSICFAIPSFVTSSVGGAELQVWYLANEFNRMGWNVYILTSAPYRSINAGQPLNYEIKFCYYKTYKLEILTSLSMLKELIKIDTDCYYQRIDSTMTGIIGVYAKMNRWPMIWACSHDNYCGKYAGLQWLKKKEWYINEQFFPKKWYAWINCFFRDSMSYLGKRLARIRLVQSNRQKILLYNKLNLKSTVVKNALPLEFLSTKPCSKKEELVLWVANMRDFKRPDLFIKLVYELKNVPFKIRMIGKCNYSYYLKQIEKCQIDIPNFKWLGQLSYNETNEYFQKAKYYVNTSDSEGFPNTFLQAMLGRTYIVSRKVDPDNIIKRNLMGFVNDDISKIAEHLCEIKENDKLINDVTDRAFDYAIKEHSIKKIYKQIETILREKT